MMDMLKSLYETRAKLDEAIKLAEAERAQHTFAEQSDFAPFPVINTDIYELAA